MIPPGDLFLLWALLAVLSRPRSLFVSPPDLDLCSAPTPRFATSANFLFAPWSFLSALALVFFAPPRAFCSYLAKGRGN